jgi:hypothetical protein
MKLISVCTDDMPLTMLQQMARRGRLEAKLSDEQFRGGASGRLAEVLQPEAATLRAAAQPLSEIQVANILAGAKDFELEAYEMLLGYQNSKGQLWHSCYEFNHPHGALVLPPRALKPKYYKLGDQTFSCFKSRQNNAGIQFKSPDNPSIQLTGFIEEIWQLPLESYMQTFFLVQKHKLLSPALLKKTPFATLPLFATTAVDAEGSNEFLIIEPRHILTHLTFYHRPKNTYGINKRILIICWALNRGRRT